MRERCVAWKKEKRSLSLRILRATNELTTTSRTRQVLRAPVSPPVRYGSVSQNWKTEKSEGNALVRRFYAGIDLDRGFQMGTRGFTLDSLLGWESTLKWDGNWNQEIPVQRAWPFGRGGEIVGFMGCSVSMVILSK